MNTVGGEKYKRGNMMVSFWGRCCQWCGAEASQGLQDALGWCNLALSTPGEMLLQGTGSLPLSDPRALPCREVPTAG